MCGLHAPFQCVCLEVHYALVFVSSSNVHVHVRNFKAYALKFISVGRMVDLMVYVLVRLYSCFPLGNQHRILLAALLSTGL